MRGSTKGEWTSRAGFDAARHLQERTTAMGSWTTRPRHGLLLLIACGAVAAGCGAESSGGSIRLSDQEPTEQFDLQVRGGAVVGGPQTFRAKPGDVVRLSVETDAADELHVHGGVDVTVKLEPEEVSSITFEVEDPGTYEVELHDTGALLGQVEVR
jgi:plastocyanin